MPRLDVWLVEKGYFSSRQVAKRAINDGLVIVDGRIAKPSKQISGKEEIVVSNLASDVPQGYEKLKQIDELLEGTMVNKTTFALDIGSSAGGFLLYLGEKGARAIGIEVSKHFAGKLLEIVDSFENLSLILDDAFTIDIGDVCRPTELDLLLVDVTTEPEGTLQLIERFAPLLKREGQLVAAFKQRLSDSDTEYILANVSDLGFIECQTLELDLSRQEYHLIAKRL